MALNCASRLSACSVLVMFSNEVLMNACTATAATLDEAGWLL
jgi:hypothetical protein